MSNVAAAEHGRNCRPMRVGALDEDIGNKEHARLRADRRRLWVLLDQSWKTAYAF